MATINVRQPDIGPVHRLERRAAADKRSPEGEVRHIPGREPPADPFVEPVVSGVVEIPRPAGAGGRHRGAGTDRPRTASWLLEEARAAPFREARPVVGRGERLVRQRMGVHDGFGADSRFRDLTRHYQAVWDAWLASVAALSLRVPPGLQRSDAAGLRAGRDRDHPRTWIVLRVPEPDLPVRARRSWPLRHLRGPKRSNGARIIAHEPGDVVLTRAPGFRGFRPSPVPLSRPNHRAALRVRVAPRAHGGAVGAASRRSPAIGQ